MNDTPAPAEKRPSPVTAFLTAVQFLLVSPAFIKRPFTAPELGAAVGFYPLVGLILGGILLAADYGLSFFMPPLVRAALLLALWVILTGALHLDGFLDACDGLFGGYTPEARLEIMRDERVRRIRIGWRRLAAAAQVQRLERNHTSRSGVAAGACVRSLGYDFCAGSLSLCPHLRGWDGQSKIMPASSSLLWLPRLPW